MLSAESGHRLEKRCINALRLLTPRLDSFCSLLQDGSCNGLQHYAALGRDVIGATSVNLMPCDVPQDVYSGVAQQVSVFDSILCKQCNITMETHTMCVLLF